MNAMLSSVPCPFPKIEQPVKRIEGTGTRVDHRGSRFPKRLSRKVSLESRQTIHRRRAGTAESPLISRSHSRVSRASIFQAEESSHRIGDYTLALRHRPRRAPLFLGAESYCVRYVYHLFIQESPESVFLSHPLGVPCTTSLSFYSLQDIATFPHKNFHRRVISMIEMNRD